MNRQLPLLAVLVVLLLTACGGRGAPTATIAVRRATPTPVATALPGIATAVPAGFEQNPLRVMLLPVDRPAAAALETRLEELIRNTSGIWVDIVFASSELEILTALCDVSSTTLTMAWVNAAGYAAASARNCGDAVIMTQRGRATGEPVQIIVNNTIETETLAGLRGLTFCRIGFDDFEGWLVPFMMLRAANVDANALENVANYPDRTAVIKAVAGGECAAAGLRAFEFEALDDDLKANLHVLSESVSIPYGILIYPFSIPLGSRLQLNDGLPELETALTALEATSEPDATAEASPEAESTPDVTAGYTSILEPFFGGERLIRIEPDDLNELDTFLSSTGLDFTQLGN